MTDALRKFLLERDPLGTAPSLVVTPADLEALVSEIEAEIERTHDAELSDAYDEGYEDGVNLCDCK